MTPWNQNSRSRPSPFCGGSPQQGSRHSAGDTSARSHAAAATIVRLFVGASRKVRRRRVEASVQCGLGTANPFDPNARRQPRQDAIVLAALIFAALGLALYFNITAIAR